MLTTDKLIRIVDTAKTGYSLPTHFIVRKMHSARIGPASSNKNGYS